MTVECVSDWTFSTPYKGTFTFISSMAEKYKNTTDLTLFNTKTSPSKLRVEVTSESIPYAKLGPENPIRHYGSLYLFECDLEDCGYTMAQVRFRVMPNSWFILVRYYLRVDNVIVRLLDTRMYHEFDTNFILREFKH